jgi:uncharacterized lipoprotein YmbA
VKLNRRVLLSTGAAFAPAILAGCASAPTYYYRLAVIPGAVNNSPAIKIGVRAVSIPGYLGQNGIAKPDSNYQFSTYSNDIWAEPLGSMLQDLTVQELAQRLPMATVVSNSGSIAAASDILIETNVMQFDPDSSGQIILIAQMALKSGRNYQPWLVQTFTYTAGVTGTEAPNLVAAMSTLWAQFIDQLPPLIIEQWNNRVAATAG